MRNLFLILLGLGLTGCGKPLDNQSSDAQVEVITDPGTYASVVMVVLPGGNGICTGTFISPKAVLTAAHCLQKSGRYQIVASFGTFTTYTRAVLGTGTVEDPTDVASLVLDNDYAKRASGQVTPMGSEARIGERIQIVGFGCNNIDTRRGAGSKRAGTNLVADVNDFIELSTPFTSSSGGGRGILGPRDAAGSCFGDSGGPMFRPHSTGIGSLVGVTHAGGTTDSRIVSQYINAYRSDIRNFIHSVDDNYNLGVYDVCASGDPMFIPGSPECSGQEASMNIAEYIRLFFVNVFNWLSNLWLRL